MVGRSLDGVLLVDLCTHHQGNQVEDLMLFDLTECGQKKETYPVFFFFSSRRRHTRLQGDWSSDVCSSDLATCYTPGPAAPVVNAGPDLSASTGDTVTVTAAFTDPGPNDAPWTYTMTWGDGKIGRASCRERV